jgi:small subunit ribosomal protein S1
MTESNSAEPSSAEPQIEAPKPEPGSQTSDTGSGGLRPPLRKSAEPEFGGAARLRNLEGNIDKELEEAMGGISEKELYGDQGGSDSGGLRPPLSGQAGVDDKRKKGRVLAIRGPDVFVDVPGGRSQGVIPASQFPDGPPAVGSEVEFHIEGYDNENGLLLLARQGAAQTADWSSVAVGMIVEARVTATNKGGLAVDVNGIRGFMPISQIDLYRVEDTQQFVNQRLRCLVTEVKPSERNLVVSRRALLEKEREENREKVWQELAEGQVREGVVRSIRDFGAFVDLGGVDGLLHVSEMSWTRVKDPSSIVHTGQTVKVVVLKIDRERRKVSLGLKQLTSSPWDNIESRYPAGSVVKGKVTRLAEFGAFVELEPGVEGLIHISELAPQRVRRVADIVQPEQEVQVMVLNVDSAQRRISLSLKATLSKEEEPPAEETEPEAEALPERPRNLTLRGGIGSE